MIPPIAWPLSAKQFLGGWVPALAVSAVVPAPALPLGERFLIDLAGLPVPVVTCALGAIGIIAARPFTVRAEADLGWKLRLLVSFIMLVIVELWIVESRPGWLFAFVVAIGLGFSGYSLLELFGNQVKDFVRRTFSLATDTIKPSSSEAVGPQERPDGK
jgi:hypothetical protein